MAVAPAMGSALAASAQAASAPLIAFDAQQVLEAPQLVVAELRQADFARVDSAEPLSSRAPWTSRSLPDAWLDEPAADADPGIESGAYAWYRFTLPWPVRPAGPQAIYLWSLQGEAEVYFNGSAVPAVARRGLGAPGAFDGTLLAPLPDALWLRGPNRVQIRLQAPPRQGGIGTLFAGPRDELEAAWRIRSLVQGDLAAGTAVLTLLMAAVALLLRLRRSAAPGLLWFGLAQVAFAVACLDGVILALPDPGGLGWRLAGAAMVWWSLLLALCAQRLLGVERRLLDGALVGVALLAAAIALGTAPPQLLAMRSALEFASLVIAAGVLMHLALGWRGGLRDDRVGALAIAMAGVVILGLHDVLFEAGIGGEAGRFRLRLLAPCVPLLFPAVLWTLARRPAPEQAPA
ncbi:MAG TPA: hypothetical protein VLA56_08440 [Pseudomonadales bacterium]|nr:hypothetical protein [Pseudomonadales bacterium]